MSRTYVEPARDESPASILGNTLLAEFERAEKARTPWEESWLKSARQYAGKYEPHVESAIQPNKSKVFVRHTKAKCDALKARLMDLLFPSNNARNWSVCPSPRPEIPEIILLAEEQELMAKGEHIPQDHDLFVREVAEKRARAMENLIEDQLNGSRIPYRRVCANVIRNGIVYGAGVLKGPMIELKEAQSYVYDTETSSWSMRKEQGEDTYQPYFEEVPLWDLYPDPAALCPQELNFIWQSHIFTRREVLDLATKYTGFSEEKIREYLSNHLDGDVSLKPHEQEMRNVTRDGTNFSQEDLKDRFRILERWGFLRGQELIDAGVDVDALVSQLPGFDPEGSYANSLWMTNSGDVIKCAIAPVEGLPIPYYFFRPYADGTSFWGESLPDIIRDPQVVINAAARMTLDNAAVSCAPQIGVNVRSLDTNDDPTEVFGGKVWLFDGPEKMSECIKEISVSSHVTELMAIAEKYAQYSDETSLPRYMNGTNYGVRGAGDTASGLSMLMNSASMPVKDIVSEFDLGITEPFIRAMYRWNMRYSNHKEVKGDYEVRATGSTVMIAQELMGQRLLQVMQVLAGPGMANLTNFETLYGHILRAMDLPSDIKLTHEEAKFKELEQMKMEKAAQLDALMGEVQKRNMPVEPELMNMIQQIIASLGGVPGAEMRQATAAPEKRPYGAEDA